MPMVQFWKHSCP